MECLYKFGNRCDHDISSPRFYDSKMSIRPSIIKLSQYKLEKFYEFPSQYLKRLCYLHDKKRIKKSERRESICAVMQVVLQHMDINTLLSGTPNKDGTFSGIELAFISAKTGFSRKRVYRALLDMNKCNYIMMRFRRIKKYGRFLTIRSIKVLQSFFNDLNISKIKIDISRNFSKRKNSRRKNIKRTQHQTDAAINNIAILKDMLSSITNRNIPPT